MFKRGFIRRLDSCSDFSDSPSDSGLLQPVLSIRSPFEFLESSCSRLTGAGIFRLASLVVSFVENIQKSLQSSNSQKL